MAYRKLGVDLTVVEAAERVLPATTELTSPCWTRWKSGVVLHLGCQRAGLWDAEAQRACAQRARRGIHFALPKPRARRAVGRSRAPRASAWSRCSSTWPGAMWRWMRSAAPPCATSGPSATSRATPCWRTAPWRRRGGGQEAIAGKHRRFEPMAIRPASPTPRWWSSDARPARKRAPRAGLHHGGLPICRQRPRAMTLEAAQGFVRVVARRDNHLILGWQAVARAWPSWLQPLPSPSRWAHGWRTSGTIHAHPHAGRGGAGSGAAGAGASVAYLTPLSRRRRLLRSHRCAMRAGGRPWRGGGSARGPWSGRASVAALAVLAPHHTAGGAGENQARLAW